MYGPQALVSSAIVSRGIYAIIAPEARVPGPCHPPRARSRNTKGVILHSLHGWHYFRLRMLTRRRIGLKIIARTLSTIRLQHPPSHPSTETSVPRVPIDGRILSYAHYLHGLHHCHHYQIDYDDLPRPLLTRLSFRYRRLTGSLSIEVAESFVTKRQRKACIVLLPSLRNVSRPTTRTIA
jgi:hypothetical protein